MKPNLNRIDQIARAIVGGLCIYLGFLEHSVITEPVLAIAVGVFGIVNLIAAASRFCPVYHLAGFSTVRQ